MDPAAADVIAVVGTCAHERAAYASHFATRTDRTLHTAARVALSPDPVDEALALAPWSGDRGAVVEFPTATMPTAIIGAFAAPDAAARLTGLICVVDAMHLVDDLRREDYVLQSAPVGLVHRSRALVTAAQIEYATTVVLAGWEPLSTPELSTAMALLSALAPRARLRLHPAPVTAPEGPAPLTPVQDRPGWIAVLNDDHDPHMTDPRVRSMRYQAERPFHPGRLRRLLDGDLEGEAFGVVLRSAGFCRLATRPGATAHWEHVGSMFSLPPVGTDDELGDDDELLTAGVDIALIGLDLDVPALTRALDDACLSDAELAAGPSAWRAYADPFPAWSETGA